MGTGVCHERYHTDLTCADFNTVRLHEEGVARRDVALEPMAEKKSAGRTKAGVELTEDVLNRLAAEAESELDLSKLRRRPGRPSMGSGPADTLPVRLDPELRKAVDDRAVADDTTTSDVVREALRQYLIAG